MTRIQLTAIDHRAQPTLATRVAGIARRAWHVYWDRRARQATVEILRSLDSRTLRDIGLSRSEIESAVYGRCGERRRRYEEGWR
jgi:uncharacterized protein YjiS (DUF1127 family)